MVIPNIDLPGLDSKIKSRMSELKKKDIREMAYLFKSDLNKSSISNFKKDLIKEYLETTVSKGFAYLNRGNYLLFKNRFFGKEFKREWKTILNDKWNWIWRKGFDTNKINLTILENFLDKFPADKNYLPLENKVRNMFIYRQKMIDELIRNGRKEWLKQPLTHNMMTGFLKEWSLDGDHLIPGLFDLSIDLFPIKSSITTCELGNFMNIQDYQDEEAKKKYFFDKIRNKLLSFNSDDLKTNIEKNNHAIGLFCVIDKEKQLLHEYKQLKKGNDEQKSRIINEFASIIKNDNVMKKITTMLDGLPNANYDKTKLMKLLRESGKEDTED